MKRLAKLNVEKNQRGHLSQELLVQAALRIACEQGVDCLTMKRLASVVNVTPMAIYRYFGDKSQLIDAVLDQYVRNQNITGHTTSKSDWAQWLKQTYSRSYFGLKKMPSLFPYLGTATRFGSGASDVVTATLEVLQNAGFGEQRALSAAKALNGFTIGCAMMDHSFYQSFGSAQSTQDEELYSGLKLIISGLQQQLENSTN